MWQRKAIRHGGTFFKHVIPAIIKPLHALWNEVIGFLFLCFALGFAVGTFKAYKAFAHASPADGPVALGRLLVTGLCTLMMAWFGISNFLRARKISRS